MPSMGRIIRNYERKPQGVYDQIRCPFNCIRGSIAIRTKEGLYKCTNCRRFIQKGFNTYTILQNKGL